MRYPTPEDPELWTAIRQYVDPGFPDRPGRYMKLLGGRLLDWESPERDTFMQDLGRDARHITDRELSTLLDSEWRSRLTAAWLIGLDHRTQFRDRLGALLLESEVVYAGMGYCLALARFGTAADAELLCAYLDRYLPQTDLHYNQDSAIGALLHVDKCLASNRADWFLAPGGLWESSAFGRFDPAELHRRLAGFCAFADECMQATGGQRDTPGGSA